MSKLQPLTAGQSFAVRRNGGDHEIYSDTGRLLFKLIRPWENRYNREWHFTLWRGEDLLQATNHKLQPVLTLIRLQQESLVRLQAPGEVLTDIVRIDTSKGYVGSDPRHRFVWEGQSYLLTARTHSRLWGGRDIDCVDEQTGVLVMQFKQRNFSRHNAGTLSIADQLSEESLSVMVAAFFAFKEFDQRLKLLTWGDPVFTANVTG